MICSCLEIASVGKSVPACFESVACVLPHTCSSLFQVRVVPAVSPPSVLPPTAYPCLSGSFVATNAGHAFLKASSCDEYVWALLFAAQERGVGLTPAIMPQKYKIVIYSHTAPEHIVIDSTGGDPAAGSGTGGAEGGNNSSATDSYSSAALTSWLSSSTEGEQAVEDESKEAGGERGDGDGSSGEASADDGTTGGGGGGGDTRRLWTAFQGIEGTPASSSLPLESSSGGDDDRGGAGGLNATEAGVEHEDPAGRTTVPDSEGHDEDGGDESNGAAAAALVTLQPTEVPVALDDWQQVVAYYQSLQLCLQEVSSVFVFYKVKARVTVSEAQ